MPPKRAHIYLNDELEVKTSTLPNAGRGLFARRIIFRYDFIGCYIGEVLDYSARDDPGRDTTYCMETYEFVQKDKKTGKKYMVPRIIIDGACMENYMRWINDPREDKERINARAFQRKNGELWIRAVRDIMPGREILMSYGEEYWKHTRVVPPIVEELPPPCSVLESSEVVVRRVPPKRRRATE